MVRENLWLNYCREQLKSPAISDNFYNNTVRRLVTFNDGSRLSTLTPELIDNWQFAWNKQHISDTTVTAPGKWEIKLTETTQ